MTVEQKRRYYTSKEIYQNKITQLNTVEEAVCWLFNYKEHLRNCTKCLIFNYWYHVDGLRSGKIDRDVIHRLTPPETITRVARHIQNDLGLWLPTDKKEIEARKINELAVAHWSIAKKRLEPKWARRRQY